MIYLVLAVIILHIVSAPISVSAEVNVDTDVGDGNIILRVMLIPIFKKRINTNVIKDKIIGQSSDDRADDEEEKEQSAGKSKTFLIACAKKIVSRVRVRAADLSVRLGTGDAAADGMSVGMLKILYLQACAFFGFDGNADVRPDFDNTVLVLSFFGIFSLCFADIIIAVCTAFFERIKRAGKRRGYANVAE